MDTTVVFVYGTLRRAEPNHFCLAGAVFIGETQTAPGWGLLHLGGFPGMVRIPKAHGVMGELYEAPNSVMDLLDQLEGVPYLFQRSTISTELLEEVTAYTLARPDHNYPIIPSGDWKEARYEQPFGTRRRTPRWRMRRGRRTT